MRSFSDEQGRTRVFVEAYRSYSADGLFTSRRRKPAENAAHRKKGHLWMETDWYCIIPLINNCQANLYFLGNVNLPEVCFDGTIQDKQIDKVWCLR